MPWNTTKVFQGMPWNTLEYSHYSKVQQANWTDNFFYFLPVFCLSLLYCNQH